MRLNDPLELAARVDAGPPTYRFHTADGVASPDGFRDADRLLCDGLWDAAPDSLCHVEAGYGVVGCVLAARADVTMTASSARAVRLCERNAAANGVEADVHLGDPGRADGRFDAVAYAPRPDTPLALGRRRLAAALAACQPDGRLYLAAAPTAGLERYETTLADRGADPERVDALGDCRLVVARRPVSVDVPTVEPTRLTPTVAGVDLDLRSRPGLFAARGLDDGTRLLAGAAGVADGERVLDLGCGYGPLGVHAALTADCEAWLTDVSAVATRCATASVTASGVGHCAHVVTADCADGVEGAFDRVLCNPPTHAGAGVLADLFDGAHAALRSGGECRFVRHRSLDLRPHCDRFATVDRLRTGADHVVMRART